LRGPVESASNVQGALVRLVAVVATVVATMGTASGSKSDEANSASTTRSAWAVLGRVATPWPA